MQRARDARYFGGRWSGQLALAGHLAASLFLRSYERAERVQMAMLSRGWDGNISGTGRRPWRVKDIAALASGFIVLCGLWLIRRN
jgi:cobalt/nickel transport system permease protein